MDAVPDAPEPAPAPAKPDGARRRRGGTMAIVAGLGVAVAAAGILAVVASRSPGAEAPGAPSAACRRAAACCRELGNSRACDNYLKQSGPAADKACADTIKAFRHLGRCR